MITWLSCLEKCRHKETDRKEKLNAKQKYDAKRATLDEQLLNRNGYFTDEFGLERQLSDKSPN